MTIRTLLALLVALVGVSTSAQTPLGTFASGLDHPHDVIQLADGRILVSSEEAHEIQAYAPDGTNLGAFATFDGPFGPKGLAQLADGRVLATVRFDVRAFSPDGTELDPFVTDLNLPVAIAQLADGRVLVAEFGQTEQGRVTAFAPDGGSRRRFATELRNPFDLVQLEDGRVLVVEFSGGRIQEFEVDGTLLGEFGRLNTVLGIAQLEDGRVLIGNLSAPTSELFAFEADSTPIGQFVSGLSGPYGITQLIDGRLLVADWVTGRVEAFGVIPVASEPTPEADEAVTKVYPSPAREGHPARLLVTLSEPGEIVVSVHDATGRKVGHKTLSLGAGEGAVEVATRGLAVGVYAVRVVGPGVEATRRFVVVR